MHIIAGSLRKRPIIVPKGMQVRPTSGRLRQALFNICQTYIDDATFLDLFAGSGAIGLEAISRGAANATFVENDRHALTAIRSNIENLQVENLAQIIPSDVFTAVSRLSKQGSRYSIIYADPPYHKEGHSFGTKLLQLLDEHPLLTPAGDLFIEERKNSDIHTVKLQTLELKDERSFGSSVLFHYIKK